MAQSKKNLERELTNLNSLDQDETNTADFEKSTKLTGFRKWAHKYLILLATLGGVIFGFIEGFGLRPFNLSQEAIILISYPGELFMRVLKMLILPLIISSLITATASVNIRTNGRIAIRTLIYFVLTSLFNAFLGICLVLLIHPGSSEIHQNVGPAINTKTVSLLDNFLDLGRNMFPDNLFQASFQQVHTVYVFDNKTISVNLNDTNVKNETIAAVTRDLQYRYGSNTLGIVFFCLIFGTLLGSIGPKGKVVTDFFAAVFEVVMKMVFCVIWLTPIGISSVIAGKILSVGDLTGVISQLMWFILTVAIGIFLYQWILIQLIYFVFLRKNPYKFYCKLIEPMLTGAAAASSAAALPVTFRCMNEKVGVDRRITQFILPIGCNVNLDGTALFVAVATVFVSQMSGKTLNAGELITVLLTSTIGSFSLAAVPSGAIVLLIVVLTSIDVPVEDVTLLFAIDWLLDRLRVTNNILGDCYASVIVEYLSRKELQESDAEIELTRVNSSLAAGSELKKDKAIPETVVVDMQYE